MSDQPGMPARVVVYGDGDEVLYDRVFTSYGELMYAHLSGVVTHLTEPVKLPPDGGSMADKVEFDHSYASKERSPE